MARGVVENVNVDPPSDVNTSMLLLLGDDTRKSLVTAVMAPRASEALIVHATVSKMRRGNSTLHKIVEAVVGIP